MGYGQQKYMKNKKPDMKLSYPVCASDITVVI
jgi:hypothetical protein